MRRFAEMFTALDQTTKTKAKVGAMAAYFRTAPDQDKLWTIALLSGRRPKRGVTTTLLREWAAERAGIPLWLFEESYGVVGDLSETISLVLPPPEQPEAKSLSDWITVVRNLSTLEVEAKKTAILAAWDALGGAERFLFNKLITGGLRVGVSQKLMTRALAEATEIDEAELQHRIMGNWSPETTSFHALIEAPDPGADASKPYPFYLAYQLEDLDALGPPKDWRAEMKWDGIRGQLIIRDRQHFLWSRGEELITDRFPEFARVPDFIPDGTVLDGEVLAWADEAPLPFNALQKRIGRKTVPKKLLIEAPAILLAYDLLEWDGQDLREEAYDARRAKLEALLADLPPEAPLRLSAPVPFKSWDELRAIRETSRDRKTEGLMLKRGGLALSLWPQERRLVEMEGRSADD